RRRGRHGRDRRARLPLRPCEPRPRHGGLRSLARGDRTPLGAAGARGDRADAHRLAGVSDAQVRAGPRQGLLEGRSGRRRPARRPPGPGGVGSLAMDAVLTDAFEEQRPRLNRLAYRMLGSLTEAEDVVQDAWLRWTRAPADVADPAAWLVRATTRLCIDR